MCLGNVVDQLHDEHGLANASAAKQADLASTRIGGQKIHHLLNMSMFDAEKTQLAETDAVWIMTNASHHTLV